MNNKKIVLALVLLLQFFSSESLLCAASDGDSLTLNEFYEQNGDCYLLIGNAKDSTKSGVYQLNNLTNGSTKKLYNPGNAYGITAGLAINKGALEKSLYTFISKNRSTRSGAGRATTRPMLTTWSYGTWQSDNSSTPNNVAPAIVHRYHTLPNDASTGIGNHTSSYGLYKFNNKCIPCSIDPAGRYAGRNDDGEKIYRYYIGQEWYHTVDHPAYSRYTYCTKGTSSRFARTGYTDIWMNDDSSTRRANDPDWYSWSTRYGGWVHYVAKEDITEITEKLYLQRWIVDHGFDGSEKKITDVVVGSNSNMSLKGECIDGCISDVDNISLPGEPAPHLDTAYSAQTKASYVYTRDRASDIGKLEGLQSADVIIGNGNTYTTKFVGISSRTDTGNYVYLLGSDIINQWMKDCKCPSSMYIADQDDLADVAVSDQWWQNGGIVYAYDKAKKKVYCFVRDEKLGKSDPPTEISADLGGGRLPDKIGADGFGALYLMKTDFKPDTTSPTTYFQTGAGKNNVYYYSLVGYDRGKPIFRAWYKQDIVKSVYKKPYGSDADPERLAKDVVIDSNLYFKEYQTTNDLANGPISNYICTVKPYYVVNDLSGDYRSELAVINCPTPPRPDHIKSVCDNNGPMVYNSTTHTYASASKDLTGHYPSDKIYYFMVENAPYFDSNLVNIGNTDVDIDGDGHTGRFPNTVKKESVEYHWQIRRIVDRDGKSVNEYAEENQVLDGGDGTHIVKTNNYIMPFPSLADTGTYKVGVKVTYRYYDYSKLPVGALASQKEKCLSAVTVASAPAAPAGHPEDAGYSWETIDFITVPQPPSPDGEGVIMTNTGRSGDTYLPGEGSSCGSSSCGHEQCKNTKNPPTPTFILDGHSLCKTIIYNNSGDGKYTLGNPTSNVNNWGIKVRDNTFNLKKGLNRISMLTSAPPDPHDPNMISGSLQWLTHKPGNPLQNDLKVQWVSSIKICGKTYTFKKTTSDFKLTLNEIRDLFPVPSEPMCYTLSVRAESVYSYRFMDYGPRMVAGGKTVYDYHPVSNDVPISISATAKVCITDNQGPGYLVYDAGTNSVIPGYAMVYQSSTPNFVKATTGETIAQTDGSKKLIFYVADNNPFANYNGTPDCSNGTQDKYHYSKDSRLKVNRNIANRAAYLYNENCSSGKVCSASLGAASAVSVNNSSINFGNLITADPSKKGTPSEFVTFTKYEFLSKNLKKLTSDSDDAMAFHWASNNSSYKNLKFGIRWKETSSLELTESDINNANYKKNNPYYLGTIVSIDNDRPNIYIQAKQDKFNDVFIAPAVSHKSLKADKNDYIIKTWFQTIQSGSSNYDRQGPDVWDLKGTSNPQNYFNNSLLSNNTYANLTKELFGNNDKVLLADIPVLFTVYAFDNAGSIRFDSIRIKKASDNTEYAGGPSSAYPASSDNKTIQCVFRDTTETQYYVEATVSDDARGYPTKAENDPKASTLLKDNTRNKRTIKTYFTVYPARLDYRVLDRENRH